MWHNENVKTEINWCFCIWLSYLYFKHILLCCLCVVKLWMCFSINSFFSLAVFVSKCCAHVELVCFCFVCLRVFLRLPCIELSEKPQKMKPEPSTLVENYKVNFLCVWFLRTHPLKLFCVNSSQLKRVCVNRVCTKLPTPFYSLPWQLYRNGTQRFTQNKMKCRKDTPLSRLAYFSVWNWGWCNGDNGATSCCG